MKLATLLVNVLKSGVIDLSSRNGKFLQLRVKRHKVDLNIVDNKFLKDLLKDSLGTKSFRELLRQLKNVAEELKNEGVTMTVSYKGVTVLTLGGEQKPNFSQLVKGITEIEINNLRKLIQMGLF